MLRAPPVLLVLLVLCGFHVPQRLRAQDTVPNPPVVLPSKGFRLEQNYPNPANPVTNIPFTLEESLFANGESRVVSIRIVNMFRQLVAIPKAVAHPRGNDVPVLNLRYTQAGRKVAYWDGNDMNGRRAPSGLYYCELVVDGRSDFIRIIVTQPRRRGRFPFFRRND
jgi:hypothetical protein